MNNYMKYEMQQHEFEELKRYFDLNDQHNGARFLSELIDKHIEELIYAIEHPTISPLVAQGEGLLLTTGMQNTGIQLDPQIIDDIAKLKIQMKEICEMHQKNGEHTPTIISTREQWEEMKDNIDAEEKVLVETRFDRAMGVLK